MAERVGFEPAEEANAINDLESNQTLEVPSHPLEYPRFANRFADSHPIPYGAGPGGQP